MPNFAASIIARLGLDTAGFRSELSNAARDAENAHGRIGGAASRSTGAQENLLRSNHRVAKQIHNFSRELLSGANASDVFATGLEGLGRSLNIPLGTLAGLGIGAIAVSKISSVIDEYKKLNEEVDKLARPRGEPGDRTLASVEESLTKTTEALARLKKEAGQGGIGGFFRDLLRSFGGGNARPGESEFGGVRRRRSDQIGALEEGQLADSAARTAKEARKNDITQSDIPDFLKKAATLIDSFREKIAETGTPGSPKESQTLSIEFRRELGLELDKIAKDIANARRERVQATLEEVSGRPDTGALLEEKRAAQREVDQARAELSNARRGGGTTSDAQTKLDAAETKLVVATKTLGDALNKFSLIALHEGSQARDAQSEIALSKQSRDTIGGKAGLEEAQHHINRADELKNGIESLKDSEKDLTGAFKGALDSSSVLQQIREAVKGISFANQ